MDNNKNDNTKQINIEISEQVSEGSYSNLVLINHSKTEFIFDFISVMPGVPKAKVKSRIIINPIHAKRFLKALSENVDKYESAFGDIDCDEGELNLPLNLGTTGEA